MPLSRSEAIFGIRRAILDLVDDDHSMCEVASKLGIYCTGFSQFTDEELDRRYHWLAQRHGVESRDRIEDLANRWQLARQLVRNEALACDVQTKEHDTCFGWDGFSNERLAAFYKTLCGEDVAVVPDEAASRL